MRERWRKVQQLYQGLSTRERVLVATSLLVAVIVAWYTILAGPLIDSKQRIDAQQYSVKASIEKLSQQEAALSQKLQQDPLHDLKQRLAQLNRQLADSNKLLKQRMHGLIAPQQMASVLESVLQQHRDLKLLKVKSLPAIPLVVPEKKTNKPQAAEVKHRTQVYRHGLELELEGSYMATLAYLKALQSLPWDFYWDAVRLQVEKYPMARITIEVHTLSLTEGWIGV